jgi:hypothetical protein
MRHVEDSKFEESPSRKGLVPDFEWNFCREIGEKCECVGRGGGLLIFVFEL